MNAIITIQFKISAFLATAYNAKLDTQLLTIKMIKIFHLTFVLLSIFSFVGRVILSETHPAILKQKAFKIAPHVIDTLLLISGITLVFQGGWLSREYGWIVAKIVALLGYIGLGVVVMRNRGTVRWLAFVGAMTCFVYIGIVAVTKNAFFFF
jgi:uncharacterized membrane protein SirB2